MDDVARLGFAISSEPIEKASADLDRMSDASKRAESAATSLGTTTDREMRKVGGSARSLERILAGMTGIEAAIREMQREFATYASGAQKMEVANNNISKSAGSVSAALRQQRTDAVAVVLATDQVTAAINRQNAAAAAHAQREQTRRAAGLNVWGNAPATPVATVLPEVLTTVPVKPATGGNTLPEVERSATAAANAGKMANSVLREAAFAAASMLLPVSALQFGIFTLAGAATEWAQQMLNGANGVKSVDDVLGVHEANIRRIGDSWGAAAAGLKAYRAESVDLDRLRTAASANELRLAIASETASVLGSVTGMTEFDSRTSAITTKIKQEFEPFRAEIEALRAGSIDILEFRRKVADRWNLSPVKDELTGVANALRDMSEEGAKAALALPQAERVLNGMALTAGRAAQNMGQFVGSMDKLRSISATQKSPMELAREAYLEGQARARSPGQRAALEDEYLRAAERYETSRIPLPRLRGVDDVPGDIALVNELIRTGDRRIAQMRSEAEGFGLVGAAAERYRFEQEAIAAAATMNLTLGGDQLAQIRRQASEFATLPDHLDVAIIASEIQFTEKEPFP